jgi:peroxiredoxin
VNTVLISPQPQKQTKNLVNTFELNFHFLVDHKNKVAKNLEILAKNGLPARFQILGYDSDTVMPIVIITYKEGKLIFADLTENYSMRPEPETFFQIIKESI